MSCTWNTLLSKTCNGDELKLCQKFIHPSGDELVSRERIDELSRRLELPKTPQHTITAMKRILNAAEQELAATPTSSIKTAGVVAVSGALGAAGTPVVVVAGVNAIGFGATGIATGSAAAGMMSTAAIANGGTIAAGSGVALAQSIGATGTLAALGTAGTVALMTGGGALAAVVGYGIYRAYGHWTKSRL